MSGGLVDREADDAVLQNLQEHHDVGAIPRPVSVWIFGSESDLRGIQGRLEKAWPFIDLQDSGDGWVLRAEREQPATSEAIYAMSDEVAAAIEGTDAIYDGWETRVERTS